MVFMLLASVCYAAMGASVKLAGQAELSLMTVVAGRSAVIWGLCWIMMARAGISWRPGNVKLLFGRCATGFIAMSCYFYALTVIPLANAVTIQWCSPLFVALFSVLFLRERVTLTTLVCSVTALLGVTLIVSPDFSGLDVNALFAVVSAIVAGASYGFVRGLRESDPPARIVGWFGVSAFVVSLPLIPFEHALFGAAAARGGLESLMNPIGWGWLALVGLTAFGGQILLTHAYRHGEAAWISAFSYATVPISAVIGLLVFGEVPNASAVLGAALVVGAGLMLSRSKRVKT